MIGRVLWTLLCRQTGEHQMRTQNEGGKIVNFQLQSGLWQNSEHHQIS